MAQHSVVIVGAGPAGIRAAQTLAAHGLRPLVIDEAPRSGGQIYRRTPDAIVRDPREIYGFEARQAKRLHTMFDDLVPKIDYWPNSLVWSAQDQTLHVLSRSGPRQVHWDRLIIATGAVDRILPFPGWELPGVYTLGGAQVALKYQACAIGRRPIFVGTGPLLYLVAYQYAKAGLEVAGVFDTAPRWAKLHALPGLLSMTGSALKGFYYLSMLVARGIAVRSDIRPLAACAGRSGSVSAFVWRDGRGREHQAECDSLATGFGLKSETQLADLCGARFRFDHLQRQWLPEQDDRGRASVPGIYLAGDGGGIRGAGAAELTGERAALVALGDLGSPTNARRVTAINRTLAAVDRFRSALERIAFPFPSDIVAKLPDELMICRCEGITAGALRHASTSLGAGELNRAKALSRVGMGRCQGRICEPIAAELLAATRGIPVDQVGRFRAQAPVKPIPMNLFAEKPVHDDL
jgi:hydrogen cyanide synthase HcnB